MNETAAKRTVAKNTAALLLLRVALPAFSVVLVMFLARRLGTEGLGRYTLAYAFLYFFSTLAPLGINAIITRDGAREPAHVGELLGGGLAASLISAVLVTVLMWITVALMGYDRKTGLAILVISFIVVPGALGVQLEGAASAIERMEFITISALAESLIKTAGGIGMLLAGYGLTAVLAFAVFGRMVGGAVLFVALRGTELEIHWLPRRETVSYLLRHAPTFLMISIFATLYWRIDVFMLSRMRPIEDVGFYGAAWRLLELGMVVPQTVCLAVYPQMAHSAHQNLERFGKLCRSTVRHLVAISLPIALCITVVTGPTLTMIYGPEFAAARSTLAVLIWTVVPYAWVRYNACVLLATENQKVDLALNATMTGLNIVLNLLLIPRFGYLGAAIATTASVVIYGVAQWAYIRAKLSGYSVVLDIPSVPVFGAVAAAMLAWLLRDVNVVAALAASALLYVAVLLASGFVSMHELRLLAARGGAKV